MSRRHGGLDAGEPRRIPVLPLELYDRSVVSGTC
jgi:hypothetical protein